MKNCLLRAAVLVAGVICACSDDGGASVDARPDGPAGDGSAGDGPADAAVPDADTVAALPVVAWDDTESGHDEVLLRRWNGATWEELAGSGSGNGVSGTSAPSHGAHIAFESRGNPVVAWSELVNGHSAIYLKRWDGAAWQEIAGSASGAGVSADPSADVSALAVDVDGSGRITVAESAGCCTIKLRQFDGTAWRDVGSAAALGSGDNATMVFDSTHHPVVAWRGAAGVMLLQFDGSSWQELGGSGSVGVSDGSNGVGRIALAIGSGVRPVVVWEGSSVDIYFRRWNGSTWEELDGSAASGGVSHSGAAEAPAVTVDGQNRPAVAWWDNGGVAHVRRWNGLRWEELGGITPNPGGGAEPAILALPGDALLLAYEEQMEIYARVWTGYTWEEMGTSARGLGISNTLNGFSLFPVVAGTRTPMLPEPPPGDGCTPPFTLVFSGAGAGGTANASGTTLGTSDDFRGSCIAQTSGGDVAYAFTTTTPLTLQARVTTTSPTFQPALYLRATSCRAFSDVACNVATGPGGAASLLVRNLAPGTYLLFVDGEALTSGPFTLDAALTPYPPPGETCGNAIPLAFTGGGNGPGAASAMGDNTLYGDDISSNCGGAGADVFYSFTTTVPLDFTSSVNAAFTGATTALIDAATGAPVQMCFVHQRTLPAGTYCLVVDADYANQRGSYSVSATLAAPTPGDTCVDPIPLVFTGGSASVSGTTAHDDSFGGCIGNTNGGDIVYSFTTSTTLHFTATLTPGGTSYHPALYLQRGSCGVGSIACNYCSLSCASITLDMPSLAANTYYLWVDGIDGTGGSYTLNATLQ